MVKIIKCWFQFTTMSPMEIVDLNSNESYCQSFFPDVPSDFRNQLRYGAIGGYSYQDEPLVCGGYLNESVSYSDCYVFTGVHWTPYSHNLTSRRGMGAFAYSPNMYGDGKVVAFGGYQDGAEATIEHLTPNGWVRSPSIVPMNVSFSCAAMMPDNNKGPKHAKRFDY